MDPLVTVIALCSFVHSIGPHCALALVPLQQNPDERDNRVKFVRLELRAITGLDVARRRAITQQPDRGSSEGPVKAVSPVRG
jgi:hypothetical protein